MRFLILAVFSAALTIPEPAYAWGQTGHRVVGSIAQGYLSGQAQAAVASILGDEDLVEAANYPDFMRSSGDPFWEKTALPWHYVTVPAGKRYRDIGAPAEGDAFKALQQFTATLRDPKATPDAKAKALRFIVHIVGDLHQPLHVGRPGDRGGNDVPVTWFGQRTNLHSVWDGKLIEDQQLSYSELTTWLKRRLTPERLAAWSSADPALWIAESAEVRETIYPADPALSYAYVFKARPVMNEQLTKGGVRLAAYLNWVFSPDAADSRHRR